MESNTKEYVIVSSLHALSFDYSMRLLRNYAGFYDFQVVEECFFVPL